MKFDKTDTIYFRRNDHWSTKRESITNVSWGDQFRDDDWNVYTAHSDVYLDKDGILTIKISEDDESEFKDKYILAEGYPWMYGIDEFKEIGMDEKPVGHIPVKLNWPKELYRRDLPKYRLILEIINE